MLMKQSPSPARQAEVLSEALPYLQALYGKTLVIHLHASLIGEPTRHLSLARDLALLKLVGLNLIVVHSEPRAADHAHFADAAEVNESLVGMINRSGGNAVGLSGQDGQMVRVARPTADGRKADITGITPALLILLQAHAYIPVLMPLGIGPDGEVEDLSSCALAGVLAAALKAEKLILLGEHSAPSDTQDWRVNGVVAASDMEKEVTSLALVESGELRESLTTAIHAVRHGAGGAHLIDGRVANALLLELLTVEGIGTFICSDQGPHFLADSSRYLTDGELNLRADLKPRKNLIVRF